MKYLFQVLILCFFISEGRAAYSDSQNFSRFDITFNFGPSLMQTGGIEDLGNPDLSTGLGFNFFFHQNHGIGFSASNEWDFDGSREIPLRDGSISTFDVHYAGRYFFNPKFSLVFEPGFGWQTLYDESRDYYWGYWYYDDLSTAMVLMYKLMARFSVSEWGTETTTPGSFFLGAGIQQIFTMDDSVFGEDISGSRMSLLFQAGIGF